MKVLAAKIVCDRCSRDLARIGHDDVNGWGMSVRRSVVVERNPEGEARLKFRCPRPSCQAQPVVKLATLHARAEAGETIIGV